MQLLKIEGQAQCGEPKGWQKTAYWTGGGLCSNNRRLFSGNYTPLDLND